LHHFFKILKDSLENFGLVQELMRKEKQEIMEREKLMKRRKTFKRIRLDSPDSPTSFGKKGKKKDFNNRLGTVVVGDEKIKIMIENYLKRKLKNTLSIVDRARICERDASQIFTKINK
jgi:hypothetical protein